MKIAVLIARILLGLEFLIFGLNGFFQFMHMPMPDGPAGQFVGSMVASHFFVVVSLSQVIGGVLLLSGFYIPLGLTILGPVLVCIVVFHATMSLQGLPFAFIPVVLWLIVFAGVRQAFAGIFARSVAVKAA